MLCRTNFLEQESPCHPPVEGEEIWGLWYREAAARERTVRREPRRRGRGLPVGFRLGGLLSLGRRKALERH